MWNDLNSHSHVGWWYQYEASCAVAWPDGVIFCDLNDGAVWAMCANPQWTLCQATPPALIATNSTATSFAWTTTAISVTLTETLFTATVTDNYTTTTATSTATETTTTVSSTVTLNDHVVVTETVWRTTTVNRPYQ